MRRRSAGGSRRPRASPPRRPGSRAMPEAFMRPLYLPLSIIDGQLPDWRPGSSGTLPFLMGLRPRNTPETRATRRWPAWIVGLLLLAAMLAAYSAALRGGLLWDDDKHVT